MEVPEILKKEPDKGAPSRLIKRGEETAKMTKRDNSDVITAENAKLMSYYCFKFALDKTFDYNKDKNDATINGFIMSTLLPAVETKKREIGVLNPEGDKQICTSFTLEIYKQAAEMDENQATTKATAKLFNTAAGLLEALGVFGEISRDLAEKKKWANYRAVNILKADREGRSLNLDKEDMATLASQGDSSSSSSSGGGHSFSSSNSSSFDSSHNSNSNSNLSSSSSSNNNFSPHPPSYNTTVNSNNNYLSPSAPPAPFYSAGSAGGPMQLSNPNSTVFNATMGGSGGSSGSTFKSDGNTSPISNSPRGQAKLKDDPRVMDAVELTQFAIAALKRNPHDGLAKERLQAALARLEAV